MNELSPGVSITSVKEGKRVIFSLGMMAVLARARVMDFGENSDGRSSTCQFLV